MVALQLTGRINDKGELEVELPKGIEPGEVQVTIEPITEEMRPWTDEEIAELLTPGTPKTGAEIVAMLDEMGPTGWEDVSDGAEWVEEQRRKERERNKW